MNKQSISLNNILSSQRIALSTILVLTGAICFMFFDTIWQWYADWGLVHRSLTEETLIQTTDNSAEIIAAIPGEHLFGQSLTKLGEMPISDLELRVTGIIKVENAQAKEPSKAFISVSQQPSKIFKVGDHLPYGAKVYDITAEAVVIENNGHFEKLPLPRKTLEFKANRTHVPKTIVEEYLND